jgi:hypothetical protein
VMLRYLLKKLFWCVYAAHNSEVFALPSQRTT